MRIYYLFISLSFFISSISYSQKNDTVICSVKYQFLFAPDSLRPENKQSDMLVLEIGKNLSSCYSLFNKRKSEEVINDLLQSENGSGIITIDYNKYNGLPNGRRQIEMKLTSQNKMIVLDNIFGFKCYYTDSLNLFTWKLTSDTATVLNFLCQKATAHFKGRDYIAWFSTELLFSNGPMKFGGLPGLILKIHDSKNNFEFTCIGIEKPKEASTISLNISEYQKYSKEEIKKMRKIANEDPVAFINSTVPNNKITSITLPNSNTATRKQSNPLELE